MTTTTAQLIQKYSDLLKHATEHKLTSELCAGTLSDRTLCIYLAQDLKFFNTSFRLICKTTTECPNDKSMIYLGKKIGFFANDENDYFQKCLELLATAIKDDADKEKNCTNEIPSTTRYLKSIQAKLDDDKKLYDYPKLITALWTAEIVYYLWAHNTPRKENLHWKYQTWIDLHDGPHFEEWCDFLAKEVDQYSLEQVEDSFKQCVELEINFFNGCYNA
ncbi:hypothetical protein TPHA_0I00680 [Tetrapisispora phaffii CBS 4417]|uniref:Thiaminase-2/PQQC domain-containing protein n=1 Tax=Tetrapisispora phaffii (strain ATCC 24235 / CBS 4417 / NBRC 1672 / NRRL Y-8282 / UCD 70-5) TaxID=1071381 RepID=G8BXE6_TETPH|nr:hypothetical protein TPHA_0I00680 [Tetrapisispora phaffii CBS 4417]CCE64574.1 hypothetical protein TPHA_0I00680 [Tetrapisispora phaffii CBS 4417]